MITQKRKFLYQPQLLNSCICWSWTLIVLLIGIIVWLEITTFQTTTLLIFIVFAFLTWIQVYFRKLFITKKEIKICSVFHPFGKTFYLKSVSDFNSKRNSISFNIGGKQYKFLVPSNSAIELSEILNKSED